MLKPSLTIVVLLLLLAPTIASTRDTWKRVTISGAGSAEANGPYLYSPDVQAFVHEEGQSCWIEGCFDAPDCPTASTFKWILNCDGRFMYSYHTGGKADFPPGNPVSSLQSCILYGRSIRHASAFQMQGGMNFLCGGLGMGQFMEEKHDG